MLACEYQHTNVSTADKTALRFSISLGLFISIMSDLECPICLSPFGCDGSCEKSKPCLLTGCGHNICGLCLDGLRKERNFICPLCRASFDSPASLVTKNLYLERKIAEETTKSRKRPRDDDLVSFSCNIYNSKQVDVYEVMSTVGVRRGLSLSKDAGNWTALALEPGRVVSGTTRIYNGIAFLELESGGGYVPIVASCGTICLRWSPVQPGLTTYRVSTELKSGMALRHFPDSAPECQVAPAFILPPNSLVMGSARVRGQYGDIFVRFYDSLSGNSGWLFETRENICTLLPVVLSTPVSTTSALGGTVGPAGGASMPSLPPSSLPSPLASFDVSEVRTLAASLGYEVLGQNDASRVISFRRSEVKINV